MTIKAVDAPTPTRTFVDSDGIVIREAVEGDNDALLELTRLTPMAGSISLRIDREPDFFALPRVRRETMVFVATSEGKLMGCMSASIHMAHINGVPERIARATDLKVHPLLTGKRVTLRLISAIANYQREQGVDLSFSLVRTAIIAHQETWKPAANVLAVLRGPDYAPIPDEDLRKTFPELHLERCVTSTICASLRKS